MHITVNKTVLEKALVTAMETSETEVLKGFSLFTIKDNNKLEIRASNGFVASKEIIDCIVINSTVADICKNINTSFVIHYKDIKNILKYLKNEKEVVDINIQDSVENGIYKLQIENYIVCKGINIIKEADLEYFYKTVDEAVNRLRTHKLKGDMTACVDSKLFDKLSKIMGKTYLAYFVNFYGEEYITALELQSKRDEGRDVNIIMMLKRLT